MPRGRADIANTVVRILLQDVGERYDTSRKLEPYNGRKHFAIVRQFFGDKCCYCGDPLQSGRVAQDHLLGLNKDDLGLHAWGNIVPACGDCNAKKQHKPWKDFLMERAGERAAERFRKIKEFSEKYDYDPPLDSLKRVASELYDEIGPIAMTLIEVKMQRVQGYL